MTREALQSDQAEMRGLRANLQKCLKLSFVTSRRWIDMDAVLLLLECIGMFLAMRWVASGRSDEGLFKWRQPPSMPKADTRPRR